MTLEEKILFVHGKSRVSIVGEGDNKKVFVNGSEYQKGSVVGEHLADSPIDVDELAHEIKRRKYQDLFKKQFKNFNVLTGAGTSIGIGTGDKVGLLMSGLWEQAEKLLTKKAFETLCMKVKHDYDNKNLEALLSLIDGNILYSGDNDTVELLKKNRDDLLSMIVDKCSLVAPDKNFPHEIFLSKITQRKPTLPRVKVFTLNYDTLFEQAANKSGTVILDGFSFTFPRTFSGRYFDYDIVQREKSRIKDEDNFISRIFHLYKLHGSINWEKYANNSPTVVRIVDKPQTPVMVYPRASKYESSYEQPFFEMMARFQQNLRKDNCLLLCIGYSFNDKHVNAAIEEALNQNPGFQLAIVSPNIDGDNPKFIDLIKMSATTDRIMMIDEKFNDFVENFPEIQTYNNESDANELNIK